MDVFRHNREAAVRVKVKKCELNTPSEWRKFSVDPQITTLEVLYSLLAKAFDTKSDFSIKYKAFDPAGNEIYLAVLSDWDLEAAFLRIYNLSIQTSAEPCLVLQMDVKPFTEVKYCDTETPTAFLKPIMVNYISGGGSGNAVIPAQETRTFLTTPSSSTTTTTTTASISAREVITPLQQSLGASQKYVQNMQTRLPGLIMNQMEKTFSMVQKALNLSEETMSTLPPRPPLSDNEFRLFLDAVGQVQRADELRKVIFFGGIDTGLRRVVWKHILNVYPSGMNGHERMDYMRRKSEQYYKLRETWKMAVKQGCVVGELAYVTSMVKKDVLRTDRLHPFYAGSDDNQNIASLFNILTTYALNHPTVSYCQGMSDIASPLLVTMNDEAHAYICFCAIMFRLRGNFMLDGIAMTQKFAHLSEALSFYDPEFWEYLQSQQADDLLFCYRWLLLELKREFPFDDALHMLEVQWSSLKYDATVQNELSLFEKEFVPIMETSASAHTTSSLSSSLSTTTGGGGGGGGGVSAVGPTSPSYLHGKPRENPYTKFCALRRQSSTASLSSLSSSFGSSNSSNALDTSKRLNQSLDDNISRHGLSRRQRQVSSKAHQSLDEAKMLMLIESSEKDVGCTLQESPEGAHFQFHPTNPFKDDAQKLEGASTIAMCDMLPPSRVFLNSNSSSFAEDEVVECDEDSLKPTTMQQIPVGIAKLQNKNILTNYHNVSNIIARQLSNATTVSETVKRVGSTSGGHFRDLKEKIAATSKKGLSFDELTNTTGSVVKPPQKLVKNFNEFLNFANVNKSRIADKISNTNTLIITEKGNNKAEIIELSPSSPGNNAAMLHGSASAITMPPLLIHPVVQLTKSSRVPSLDDSDSTSSIGPDTTWSNSTAATAIQQAQEVSLQLDLNSMSSANYSYTPDRTPGTFSPLRNELANDAMNPSMCDETTTQENCEQDYYPITTSVTRELRLEAENLDRQVFGDVICRPQATALNSGDIEYEKLDRELESSSDILLDDDINELNLNENEIVACDDISELLKKRRKDVEARNLLCSRSISIQNNYRLEFEEPDDDMVNDEVFVTNKNQSTRMFVSSLNADASPSVGVRLNPFIDDSLYNVPSEGTLPNSNSLPEVLVPISTNTSIIPSIDSSSENFVELATNATDDEEVSTQQRSQQEHFISTNSAAGLDSKAKTETETETTTDLNGETSTTTLPAPPLLPQPHQFGGGNPFLMFLCLTLLLQHRNTIMKSGMDYNEIAMHFDKMVRKHDVTRVLNQARRMYIDYLKTQNTYKQRMQHAASAARGTKKLEKNSTQLSQQRQ